MSVALFVREDLIASKLLEINAYVPKLQAIVADLVSLGKSDIAIADIESLVENNGTIKSIKEFVFGGEYVTISTFQVPAATLGIDMALATSLSNKIQKLSPTGQINYSHYEIAADVVALAANVEADLEELHTVYGSELAEEIIDDVTALCTALNAIYTKMGVVNGSTGKVLPYHPLRNPERLLDWDGSQFVANKFEIARHVK